MSGERSTTPPFKIQEPVMYDWRGTFAQFYKLQQSGTLCDLTVQTQDGDIPAHSLVMFTRVPYFRALLEFVSTSHRFVVLVLVISFLDIFVMLSLIEV